MAKTEIINVLGVIELMHALEQAPDYWLTPQQVAAITNMSLSWLAAAREGLKEHPGPPHMKIGSGQTAPVRYRAGDLRDWMNAFQSQLNTSGARYTSHRDFMARAMPDERWLYAIDMVAFERIPIYDAFAGQRVTPSTKFSWVSRRDSELDTWTVELRLPVSVLKILPAADRRGLSARVVAALKAYEP